MTFGKDNTNSDSVDWDLLNNPHYKFIKDKRLKIVLAPFSGGQPKKGVEKGPLALLNNNLNEELFNLGWNVQVKDPLSNNQVFKDAVENTDKKDPNFIQLKNVESVGIATDILYNDISSIHKESENNFVLTLGGDHSIAMGSIAAALDKYPDLGVLWIDAHADINTVKSTNSGNLHGCPVSFLMGLNDEIPKSFHWNNKRKNLLKKNKIVYIGLRDVDEGEKLILKENNIKAFSMYHIDKYGINTVIEMALKLIDPTGQSPILLSYDVDAIDPMYVPATGTPVRGGLTLREGLFITERLAEYGNLVAMDIVECNPDLALNDSHVLDTISTGCALARCALGETLL